MNMEAEKICFFRNSLDHDTIAFELKQAGVNFFPIEKLSGDQITTCPIANILSDDGKPISDIEIFKERNEPGYFIRGSAPDDLIVGLQDKIPELFDGLVKRNLDSGVVINDAEQFNLFVKITKKFYRQNQTSNPTPIDKQIK